MSVVKVIELVGTSRHNWTDAVDNAVMEAAKTIDDVVGVEVTNFTANIDNGRIEEYKADLKVAFRVHNWKLWLNKGALGPTSVS